VRHAVKGIVREQHVAGEIDRFVGERGASGAEYQACGNAGPGFVTEAGAEHTGPFAEESKSPYEKQVGRLGAGSGACPLIRDRPDDIGLNWACFYSPVVGRFFTALTPPAWCTGCSSSCSC
jgi:hypothetical protein